jgi:hypothetical protein
MPADRLTQLQEKLISTNCPHCHHTLSSLVLRCDAYYGSECVALSQCEHCQSWVDIEQALTMDEEFHEVTEGARALGCRTCRSHDLRIEYRCELTTRECFYEATCQPAGHQHRI